MTRKIRTPQQMWRSAMREITSQGEAAIVDGRQDDPRLELLIKLMLDMLIARGIVRAEEVSRTINS